MALEDFMESEVAIAVAATAVVLSPRAREIARRGAVFGLAGLLMAGDALGGLTGGLRSGIQQATTAGAAAGQAAAASASAAATHLADMAEEAGERARGTVATPRSSEQEAAPAPEVKRRTRAEREAAAE